MNNYQRFIHLSRYARFRDDLGRRETWEETVERLAEFWSNRFPEHTDLWHKTLAPAILGFRVMPSMRTLMTAGEALDRDHVAGYNCSFLAVDSPRAFDEAVYVLMCGTGVGYSVERQYIAKLPGIPENLYPTETTIVVPDSKIGWAKSVRELVAMLYAGHIPKWDVSRVRPAGARLKTFGGRASGPEPLEDLFRFTVELFRSAAGRKLNSLECHDLMCKIAEIVVVGGVRRSALLSLSNLTDDRMRHAKTGSWWERYPWRAMANNSVAYTEKPDSQAFLREWLALVESGSGERGIFNRVSCVKNQPPRRAELGYEEFGTNPCSEIVLRSNQFCNLSEVVARPNDTERTLAEKVRLAAIIGTFQATLTDFRYLSSKWRRNTEEEALLGVSITGIMDCPLLSDHTDEALGHRLAKLRQLAVETNREWAEKLVINPATAVTCVKPSGTVSQLVDSASGIHPRYAPFYIRRVRADKKDPLAIMMRDMGFPCEDDVMKPDSGFVFSFPHTSPSESVFRDQRSAIEQLNLWLVYQQHWCEHKPSITVYVRPDEWPEVGAWVYRHFDWMSGVSFLPHTDHVYQQAPYEEVDEKRFQKLVESMPENVDWSKLGEYETSDNTTVEHELACSAGACEL